MSEQNNKEDPIAPTGKDIRDLIERLNTAEKEIARLNSDKSKIVDEDEDQIVQRKSVAAMRLRTIGGKPIVNMTLVPEMGVSANDTAFVKSYMAHCVVAGSEKVHKIPYMNGMENSYEKQPLKEFEIVDANGQDESGASSIQYNQVMSRGGKVPEIDRSGPMPRATGRMVPLLETRDFRKYTILVDGEKVVIDQDHIYS